MTPDIYFTCIKRTVLVDLACSCKTGEKKGQKQVCKSPFKTTPTGRTAVQRDSSKLQKQTLTKFKITQTPDRCIVAKTNWQKSAGALQNPNRSQ